MEALTPTSMHPQRSRCPSPPDGDYRFGLRACVSARAPETPGMDDVRASPQTHGTRPLPTTSGSVHGNLRIRRPGQRPAVRADPSARTYVPQRPPALGRHS